MDWFLILGIVAFFILVVSFWGYSKFTDDVIKQQEREIAKYKSEIIRLKSERSKTTTTCIEIINPELQKRIPDFKDW